MKDFTFFIFKWLFELLKQSRKVSREARSVMCLWSWFEMLAGNEQRRSEIQRAACAERIWISVGIPYIIKWMYSWVMLHREKLLKCSWTANKHEEFCLSYTFYCLYFTTKAQQRRNRGKMLRVLARKLGSIFVYLCKLAVCFLVYFQASLFVWHVQVVLDTILPFYRTPWHTRLAHLFNHSLTS